jgi:hypothetical protein
VAEPLQKAWQVLRIRILNPQNVSTLTGRLKRRVVLDWEVRMDAPEAPENCSSAKGIHAKVEWDLLVA